MRIQGSSVRCQVSGLPPSPRLRLAGTAQVAWVLCVSLLLPGCDSLMTADQRGQRLYDKGQYSEAADRFADPMWMGVSLFKAGEFKDAAGIFSGYDTAEGAFNHGNALVMLGKYEEAAARYQRAMELKPGWESAAVNLGIALARAKQVETTGGNMTGGEMEPDEITFEKGKAPEGAGEEQIEGGEPMSDVAMRALWLRRVQTRPADFLQSKFAYQHSRSTNPSESGETP